MSNVFVAFIYTFFVIIFGCTYASLKHELGKLGINVNYIIYTYLSSNILRGSMRMIMIDKQQKAKEREKKRKVKPK